jgi:hypothetical protein
LTRLEAEGEIFLSQTVTADETWVHHFEPQTKRQYMEWHNPQAPQKKKFKTFPSGGKVVITVFWDCEGVILVDAMPRGETINSDAHISMLTEHRKHFK